MKPLSLALILALGLPALAQPAGKPAPKASTEVVMDASGKIVAPWTKGKSCPREGAAKDACRWVVINGQTREIARIGDRWASKFAPTGIGREVRRIETAMDKATRLSSGSAQ